MHTANPWKTEQSFSGHRSLRSLCALVLSAFSFINPAAFPRRQSAAWIGSVQLHMHNSWRQPPLPTNCRLAQLDTAWLSLTRLDQSGLSCLLGNEAGLAPVRILLSRVFTQWFVVATCSSKSLTKWVSWTQLCCWCHCSCHCSLDILEIWGKQPSTIKGYIAGDDCSWLWAPFARCEICELVQILRVSSSLES